MHYPRSTYKQILSYLFLSIYVCCTLSFPIFEGVHFLLHLGDETTVHSFHSHQSLHNHQVLTVLNSMVDKEGTSESPTEIPRKIKVNKLVQILCNPIDKKIVELNNLQPNYSWSNLFYESSYPPILVPPPKVFTSF